MIRVRFLVGFGLLIWLVTCCAPLTGLYVESNKRASEQDLGSIGINTLKGMKFTVDGAISPMVDAAHLVKKLVPEVASCDLNGFSSASVLADVLATYTTDLNGAPHLQGVGVMTFAGAGSGAFDFGNKISYELTNGTIVRPPCQEFLFGFTDNDTTYSSYCMDGSGQFVVPAVLKYSGPDYGATDQERRLMLGETGPALFTPVFDLVGRQSISYELAKQNCVANVTGNYAIAFAQTNLLLLSGQLQLFDIDGVSFIIERSTGLLVAASIPDQTVLVTAGGGQERIAAVNSTNKLISAGGRLVMKNIDSLLPLTPLMGPGIVVFALPYEYPNSEAPLGWANVVVLRTSDFVTTVYRGRNRALYGVLLVLTFAVAALVTIVLIRREWDAVRHPSSVQPLV